MVAKILSWLWQKTDGWKMVIGFVLSHIPAALGNPDVLVKAVEDALASPSWGNAVLALGQLLLLLGAFLKAGKNLGLLSAENDAVVKKLELPPEFKR